MNKKTKYIKRIVCILYVFTAYLFASTSFGQSIINIYKTSGENSTNSKSIKYKSEDHFQSFSKNLIIKAQNQGYIAASIDSTIRNNATINIFFNSGEKYFLKEIQATENNKRSLKSYSINYLRPKKYNLRKIDQKKKNIVNDFQNQGFPFIQLYNKTLIDSAFNIYHEFHITTNEFNSFESLHSTILKPGEIKYLSRVTRIRKDKPYQKKRVDNIEETINNTGIYNVDSLDVSMNNNKVKITPHLSPTKQNKLSGWLGIQTDKDEKTTFTGNIEFHTKNIFKIGENIFLEWRKQGPESQLLNINTQFPFVAGLPIGVFGDLYIDKRDSTFSNQYYKLGLIFLVADRTELSGYYSGKNSTTYDFNEENTNAKQSLYGLNLQYSRVNNVMLPTKGLIIKQDINAGNRSANKSTENLIVNYESDIFTYFRVPLGSTMIRNQTGFINNDSVSINEYFQLGGIKTMRGFNENSIFSKLYNITTLEYRILLNSSSYFNFFYDFGFFKAMQDNIEVFDYRQTLGLGLTLSTKAGMLSLSYALGKLNSDPLELKSGKIHIGYTSTF